jgi:predicted aldo/keto reductase-like oxidoreductase
MIEKTRLGKTDMMVTRIGFGGIPIQRLTEEDAVAVVKGCLDRGINYIDTANGYSTSEERIGKAIAGRRESVFLATKTMARKGEGVTENLKLSLKRLGVDYIDLYQFHGVSDDKSLDLVLAPGGPLSVAQEAKKAGIIKHIGITSHQIDAAKRAVACGHFETIMFPFNFVTDEAASELLPLAKKHDVGFIDMKPLAGGMIGDAKTAFKYLFQYKDMVTIPGIEKLSEIDEIIEVFHSTSKLTASDKADMAKLKQQLGTRFCHRCDYCQPCTAGINISMVMTYPCYPNRIPGEQLFGHFGPMFFEKVPECTKCGKCEERCPYNLPIRDMMAEYYEAYEKDKAAYLKAKAAA